MQQPPDVRSLHPDLVPRADQMPWTLLGGGAGLAAEEDVGVNPHDPVVILRERLTQEEQLLPRGRAALGALGGIERLLDADQVVAMAVGVAPPVLLAEAVPALCELLPDRQRHNRGAFAHI